MKNKRVLILLAAFTIAFIWVYAYCFDSKLDLNGDNATYLALAHHLAAGLGYSDVTFAGVSPHGHFPPGYPAFLSFFMWLGIDSLLFFKILNGLLLYASLLLLWWIVCKMTKQLYLGFIVVFLSVMTPQLQHFANIVMSEMLFLFCCVLALFALCRQVDDEVSSESQRAFLKNIWFYVAIVAAVAAYYCRAVGASIIAAVLIFYLFRRKWMAAIGACIGMFLLILPWIIRNKMCGIESRYFGTIMTVNPWRPEEGTINSAGEMFDKMVHNCDETIIKGFRELLFPFLTINYEEASSIVAIIAGVLVVGVIFYGAWKLRQMRWAVMTFLLANMSLFLLWHGGNGSRYVVPIAPFLFLCFYTGVYGLLQLTGVGAFRKEHSLYPLAFLFMFFPMRPMLKMQHEQAKAPYFPAYQNYFTIATTLNEQLPKGTLVCCRKTELFQYYAPNLFGVGYAYSLVPEEVIADMEKKKVKYVILEQLGYSSTYRYLYPAITAHPERFKPVWHLENPDTYLFEFVTP